MRTCVILNPNAGSAATMGELQEWLAQLGEVAIRQTHQPQDARTFAQQAAAEGFDRVVAAGGDGTVNQVLNGIAADLDRVTLGILPLGTGNDFARMLDMPLADPAAAIGVLAAGKTRLIDIVRVHHEEPRYFLNTAGAGFTAEVGENTDSASKEWWGSLAYVWGAAKTVIGLTPYQLRVELDDDAIALEALTLVIANGGYIGGGIPIAPWAEIDDGRLDVLILPALPLARLMVVVPAILAGQHRELEDVILRQAARVRVHCSPAMPFNVDGEPAGECPAQFAVMAGALRVLCA